MTNYLDSATLSIKTAPSSSEIYGHLDSTTISSETVLTSDDRGPFADINTVSSITTPAVDVESAIVWDITTSAPSLYVGDVITFTISSDIQLGTVDTGGGGTSGVGTTTTSYTSPNGYWGSFDDDNGII